MATHEPRFFPLATLEAAGGVRALFTGRSGGLSPQWNGGLNWSVSIGDDVTNVRQNRERSLAPLGLTLDRAVIAGLVHGDRVVVATGQEPTLADGIHYVPDCDGLITDQPGLALVVTAADCVPILLYDPVRRAIGAVHAGWRGTVQGIAGKAVRAMVETYGCDPAQILAEVGPSIGACCYQVDEAVAEPVRAQFGEAAVQFLRPDEAPGRFRLDLWAANQHDLLRSGVRSAQIQGSCTSCHVDQLFSHRAEKGGAGRGAAIIALR
jgi:YfiH family protein